MTHSVVTRLALAIPTALGVNLLLLFLVHGLASISQPERIHDTIRPAPVELVRLPPLPAADRGEPRHHANPQEASMPAPTRIPLPEVALPALGRLPEGIELPRTKIHVDTSLRSDFRFAAPVTVPAPGLASTFDPGPPVYQTAPEYPYRARRAGIEGRVVVEFTIAADGRVREPQVVAAEPPGIFERSVLQALPSWRFRSHPDSGNPAQRRARREIVFHLQR